MGAWEHAEKKTKQVSESNVKLKALVSAVREKVGVLEKENKSIWETMARREKAMQDTVERWRTGKWIADNHGENGISDVASGIGYLEGMAEPAEKHVEPPKPEPKKEYVGTNRNLTKVDDNITYYSKDNKTAYKKVKYDERAVFNRNRFKQYEEDDVIV